jgi:hypothetical protein
MLFDIYVRKLEEKEKGVWRSLAATADCYLLLLAAAAAAAAQSSAAA